MVFAAVAVIAPLGRVGSARESAGGNLIEVFELAERCGDSFDRQTVSRVFQAAAGRCDRERLVLRGPDGPTPFQLTDVKLWPDGRTVQSARVWFRAELGPLQTRRYRLEVTDDRVEPPADPDAVAVRRGDGQVEFATATCGARLRLGDRRFAPAVVPGAVPGPVASLRLADGTWFGDSRLYGDKRVTGFRAELVQPGPIVAEARFRYEYEDGTILSLRARLAAGDSRVGWSMDVSPRDRAVAVRQVSEPWEAEDPLSPRDESSKNGWRLALGTGEGALSFEVTPEFGANRWGRHEWVEGRWRDDPVTVRPGREPPGLLVNIVPWNDWWDSSTKTGLTFLSATGGRVLEIRASRPGDWVEPAAPGTWAPWGNRRMRQKWVPLFRDRAGEVCLQFSLASGLRHWSIGSPLAREPADLDRLADRVLDWPEGGAPHPRLYMSADELAAARRRRVPEAVVAGLVAAAGSPQPEPHQSDAAALGAWLLTGDRRVAERVQLVPRLVRHLALRGEFDRMRGTFLLCNLYDGVLGSGLVEPGQRQVCRARMAELAYTIADPATWSMERGYCSGNLNMSVAHVLNQGMMACTLVDHPASADWAASGLATLERLLQDTVGPEGEWPESLSNYAHVSVSAMLPFAIAARNAGFTDSVDDPRMKRLLLFIAKHYTPPDPRPTDDRAVGVAVLPPVGRSGARGRNGLPGLMARATATSDPACSAVQQWVWRRAGAPRTIPDSRLGGWEHVYLDESLPAAVPDWGLDVFPRTGAILRDAVGTRDEWWVYLMTMQPDAYPSEGGGLPLVFARGVPIIARFSGGYAEREELFINRVLPARPRGDDGYRRNHFSHEGACRIVASAATPSLEYVAATTEIGKPVFTSHEDSAHDRMRELPEWPAVAAAGEGPIGWQRQVMLVRQRGTPDTLLFLRDAVSGDRPSMWQMWLLSDGIRSVDPDRSGRDGAGAAAVSGPRELAGNGFRAAGQFGVDTDIFVARPADTPRSTLRWGRSYDYSPLAGLREDMDLLHLQRADDGDYFVGFHPHRRGERPARFESLADGAVIRATQRDRVDHVFLSDGRADVVADGVRFKGGGIVFRREPAGATVAFAARGGVQFELGAEGSRRFVELAATGASEVVLRDGRIEASFAAGHGGTSLRIRTPGSWSLEGESAGIRVRHEGGDIRVDAGPGVTAAVLREGS